MISIGDFEDKTIQFITGFAHIRELVFRIPFISNRVVMVRIQKIVVVSVKKIDAWYVCDSIK